MHPLQSLFDGNRSWVQKMKAHDQTFFDRLAEQQAPEYLWIGCADSRVPATQITNMLPGSIFVHRNVANLVLHTDLNCLAVMQYAVDVLQVKHIIICGHYGCGGVKAALMHSRLGLIDNWIQHIQDVAETHATYLESLKDERTRFDRLCELNVIEQVRNACQTTIIQGAWERGQALSVHGVIYDVADGLLRDLRVMVSSPDQLNSVYHAAVEAIRQGGAANRPSQAET
jgi:carbonic anhydrase